MLTFQNHTIETITYIVIMKFLTILIIFSVFTIGLATRVSVDDVINLYDIKNTNSILTNFYNVFVNNIGSISTSLTKTSSTPDSITNSINYILPRIDSIDQNFNNLTIIIEKIIPKIDSIDQNFLELTNAIVSISNKVNSATFVLGLAILTMSTTISLSMIIISIWTICFNKNNSNSKI